MRAFAAPIRVNVSSKGKDKATRNPGAPDVYDEDLVKDVTGKRVPVEEVPEIGDEERIDLIADLCSQLVKTGVAETNHSTRRRRPI